MEAALRIQFDQAGQRLTALIREHHTQLLVLCQGGEPTQVGSKRGHQQCCLRPGRQRNTLIALEGLPINGHRIHTAVPCLLLAELEATQKRRLRS